MKNEAAIRFLEKQISKRDEMNQKIREMFEVIITSIDDADEEVRKNLGPELRDTWIRAKIDLKDRDNSPEYYCRKIETIKCLMRLMEYSEFLASKNEQV